MHTAFMLAHYPEVVFRYLTPFGKPATLRAYQHRETGYCFVETRSARQLPEEPTRYDSIDEAAAAFDQKVVSLLRAKATSGELLPHLNV